MKMIYLKWIVAIKSDIEISILLLLGIAQPAHHLSTYSCKKQQTIRRPALKQLYFQPMHFSKSLLGNNFSEVQSLSTQCYTLLRILSIFVSKQTTGNNYQGHQLVTVVSFFTNNTDTW